MINCHFDTIATQCIPLTRFRPVPSMAAGRASTPLPAIFTGNSPPGEDFALLIAAAMLAAQNCSVCKLLPFVASLLDLGHSAEPSVSSFWILSHT